MIHISIHQLVDNINKSMQKQFPGCTIHCIEYSLDSTKPQSHLLIDDIDTLDMNNLESELGEGKCCIPPGGHFHIPFYKKGESDYSYAKLKYNAYLHQVRLLKIDDLL